MKCAASMLLVALVLVAYTFLTAKGADRPLGRVHGQRAVQLQATETAAPAQTLSQTPPTPAPEPAAAEFQPSTYAPW